jgi:hypothetical protein
MTYPSELAKHSPIRQVEDLVTEDGPNEPSHSHHAHGAQSHEHEWVETAELVIMVVRPKYVTPTAPTPEHACPIRRRVRRRAKKAFHVSWACAPGELFAGGAAGAVDAWRTTNLLGNVRRGLVDGLLRCC